MLIKTEINIYHYDIRLFKNHIQYKSSIKIQLKL
jgi:hypothetical protein